MKHILFCFLVGTLVVGCLVRAQSQRGNSNVNGNSNLWFNTSPYEANADAVANMTAGGTHANAIKRVPSGRLASKKLLHDLCGNPRLRCITSGDFRPEDLPMRISGELELFGEYRSKPFFAVVLEARDSDLDDENCLKRFSEDDRNGAQELFPNNKVFTSAAGCPNFPQIYEHAYTAAPGVHMLAVYGGTTEMQAKVLLKKVLAKKKFPDAKIHKMQAVLCNACP